MRHIADGLRILAIAEAEELFLGDFLLRVANGLHVRQAKQRLLQMTVIRRFLQTIGQHLRR